MVLVICLSIAAAFFNGLAIIIQRRAAGKPEPNELFRIPFIKNLTLNKHWLAGFGLQILAFLLQAAALRKGSLIVVEPILTVDLVFIMLILHFHYHIGSNTQGWVAIVMVCLGLCGLIASTQPKRGFHHFDIVYWIWTSGVILLLINLAVFYVRRTRSNQKRALVMGAAAGLSFALSAAFTKLTVLRLHFGFLAEFTSWPIYALILAGLLSIIMTQNTYGAGPIAISQPTMEIAEPIVSVVMAMLLFGDTIDLHPLAIVLEAVTGLVACAGVWLLGRADSLELQKT